MNRILAAFGIGAVLSAATTAISAERTVTLAVNNTVERGSR